MSTEHHFPIVGIGASAGGLAALEAFFEKTSDKTGASYIVIQHLDPRHESMTAEILTRHASIPAVQAEEGMTLKPDHIYVIPPNAYLTLDGYTCRISEAVLRHGLRMPIDTFFCSLAREHGERTVGVIASGTGSDGAIGLRDIHEAGGLAMVQSPETAQHDGMPRVAIATRIVDVVCPIEEMPDKLAHYFTHRYIGEAKGAAPKVDQAAEAAQLRSILAYMQTQLGYDFQNYKEGTIRRRIARRMGLHHIETMAGYLDYLRAKPEEVQELYRDFLISVTAFFRDADAFKVLLEKVIVPLVQSKGNDEPIRVWTPGTASGEEAYSIAMLLIEEVEKAQKRCPIQVFATDLDDEALALGRIGTYSASAVADMPAERVTRFFIKEDGFYRVNKTLRETVTFAVQNVIADPPFSRLDLISCRNLLIYLSADVQQKVIGYFHFALCDDGYLFLGHSETIGQQEILFTPVDKKCRLFQRAAVVNPTLGAFPVRTVRRPMTTGAPIAAAQNDQKRLKDLVQQQLLDRYAPAAVLINSKRQALYFSGSVSQYLSQPQGAPTQDLLSLARLDLRSVLRNAISRAEASPNAEIIETGPIRSQGEPHPVRIKISRPGFGDQKDVLLVVFEEGEQDPDPAAPPAPRVSPPPEEVHTLERELRAAREDLQSNIEELESANEELQAANEEVMSVNEELQSTNEEMETSKEELQSMNEELTTVNNQLKDKVEQLAEVNDDLTNFVSSTGIATIFLDDRKHIGRFTPAAQKLFNLITTDLGRPIGDIRPNFTDDHLEADIDLVLEKLQPVEREIVTNEGIWHLRRVLPYRTSDNRIGGVVICFIDISERLKNERKLKDSEARFRKLIEDTPDPMVIVDEAGQIVLVNAQAERFFGYTRDQLNGLEVEMLIPKRHRQDHIRDREAFFDHSEVRRMGDGRQLHALTKDGEEIAVEISLSPISIGDGQWVCASIRDVGERLQALADAKAARRKSDLALAAKSRFLATASHDLRQPLQSLSVLSETLMRQTDDVEIHKMLEMQKRSLHGMRGLLNSLLDIARLDAGSVQIDLQDISVKSVFSHLKHEFSGEARTKGVSIETRSAECIVKSDPILIKQLLQNLVENAVRFTESGAVTLSAIHQGEMVRIEVADSGPGIAPEQLSHIFEEFYQIDRDPQESRGSLGLGLSIVNRIADLLGLKLEVASTVGQGTTFSILAPAGDASVAIPLASSDAEPALPTRPREAVILLIDDDQVVLESTEALLSTESGLEILTASTPKQAYDAASKKSPDLIISDFHLGADETGLDIINELRRRSGQDLPAILITGDTSGVVPADQIKGIRLLIKPTEYEVLMSNVRRLLQS